MKSTGLSKVGEDSGRAGREDGLGSPYVDYYGWSRFVRSAGSGRAGREDGRAIPRTNSQNNSFVSTIGKDRAESLLDFQQHRTVVAPLDLVEDVGVL